MCTILRQSKTHDAAILLIGVQKGVVFLSQSRKAALTLGKGHHILVQLRIALVLVMDGQRLREQALCAALLGQIASGHQQGVTHLKQYLVLRLLQLCRRKICSGFQQLPYPCRRLIPRHRGAAVTGTNAVALRQMNTVLHEPHGIFLALIFNTASVLRAEFTAQESNTFRFRTLAHIEHRDPFRAAAAVARRIQRLVDNRLRHRAGGKQLTRSLRLRHFIDRRAAAHAKEGHLLRHHRRILQAQLDLIRAPLNEVLGHFRGHAPRKNGLRCTGEVAALPHQEPVLLGVVAHPDFVRASQHLHPYIVVAVFQKFRACRNIPVGLKIREYLLPRMLAPAVVQQNRFYEVSIQKRRKLCAPGVFVCAIQL